MKAKKISGKLFRFAAINGSKVFKGQNALKHINKIYNFWGNNPKFRKGRLYYLTCHEGFTFVNAIKSRKQMVEDFLFWSNSSIQNEDIFDSELEELVEW